MISLKDFLIMGKGVDRSEVTKAMEEVNFDDPILVVFTSVRKKCRLLLESGNTGCPNKMLTPFDSECL